MSLLHKKKHNEKHPDLHKDAIVAGDVDTSGDAPHHADQDTEGRGDALAEAEAAGEDPVRAMGRKDKMVKVDLAQPVYINGQEYPAGDAVMVPEDAHGVWKHAVKRQ